MYEQIDEIVGGIALYLFLTVTLSYFSKDKQIGFIRMFLICLLLTPVTGFVFYLLSKPMLRFKTTYECPECHFEFDQPSDHCMICKHNGRFVELLSKRIIDHP